MHDPITVRRSLLWHRLACTVRAAALALLLAPTAAAAQPLAWFEYGLPSAQAHEALRLIERAADDGLDPADYDVAALRSALEAAARGIEPDAQRRLDTALTGAMQRFLADLRRGRIEPHAVGARYRRPTPAFDAAAALREALARGRLAQAVSEAAPPLAQYADLRRALAEMRALGEHPAWKSPLPPLPRGRLDPGQPYAGLAHLAERLQALGDLPAAAALPERYEGALVEAVRRFQQRHGLAVDGIVGRATRAALEVAPAQRAQQIALAMERLRWMPIADEARRIVVNLPEFALRAYSPHDGAAGLAMPVIVGNAAEAWMRTPLIDADLRAIEFSPFWDVPRSIALRSLSPRFQRDPQAFTAEGFEFVAADGRIVPAFSVELLAAVERGEARMRQRPGPANALGGAKFSMPNPHAIYLHDSPETRLFERARRDFSHGCIRVAVPVALARFVLRGETDWTEERIRAAMAADRPSIGRPADPIPVVITYLTAVVREGRPHFFADIYGLDRVLARALARPAPASSASTR